MCTQTQNALFSFDRLSMSDTLSLYRSLYTRLHALPLHSRMAIHVPCSPVGFWSGEVTNTNRVLVWLGTDLFRESSVSEACELINRRIESIEKKERDEEQNRELEKGRYAELVNKLSYLGKQDAENPCLFRLGVTSAAKVFTALDDPSEEMVDIREPYEDENIPFHEDAVSNLKDESDDYDQVMQELVEFDKQHAMIQSRQLPTARNASEKKQVSFSQEPEVKIIPNRNQEFASAVHAPRNPSVVSNPGIGVDMQRKNIEPGLEIKEVIEKNTSIVSPAYYAPSTSETQPTKLSRFKMERIKKN